MTPPKRPPPPEAVSPRSVADTVGRGLEERLQPPKRAFSEDIVDEVHEQLRAHVEGPCELGPYVEREDQSAPGRLGGKPRAIAFDGAWWAWFGKVTPEKRENLLFLADEMDDKSAREAFQSVIAAEIRRKAVSEFKKGLKKAAWVGLTTGAFALAWVTDQVSNFVDKWPALKSAWAIIFGARN